MSDLSEARAPFDVSIDAAKLQRHIDELGSIGTYAEGGLYRPLYSLAWAEAMDLVRSWLEEIGLETRRDAVGNLFGRLRGTEPADRVVLSGSHIDTVRLGGKYDGAIGIHGAIAAVGALKEAYGRPRKHLEVYVICEEEGSRWHCDFWGTRAVTGRIQPGETESLVDGDGVTIGQAMRERGLDPAGIPAAKRDDVDAFVELHIEQGRILFDEGDEVGVVHTITGMKQLRVRVEGRQDHAGTTPMDLRRDAVAAAAAMIVEITRVAESMGRPAVATVGTIRVSPGGVNIVPAECVFTVDTRSSDFEQRQTLLREIDRILRDVAARRGVSVHAEEVIDHDPVPLSPEIVGRVEDAAKAEGLRYQRMPSGAGHDSQVMVKHFPTGMIFVPSVEGRSHTPAEYTPAEQIVPGVRVLARVLQSLAY